ncbi:MAG: hypothetical protein C9356_05090 [Oleiphilus sp.]|nr:MAG: hypothetical protein C9356_05090 [Oleiphilus sp.]
MVVSARAFKGRFFTVGISLAIVGILILMLVTRVDREIDNLEQTRFDFRLAELRSALRVKQLEIQAKGGRVSGKTLFGANPMDWIEASPEGRPSQYLGEVELASLDPEQARGNWAYDPVLRVIAYLPRTQSGVRMKAHWRELESKEQASSGIRTGARTRWLKFRVRPLMQGSRLEALKLEYLR